MKTVLIVDDNEEIRNIIRHILLPNYNVTEANCAANASIELAKMRPNLILLDINMPGINGLEWCAMIRRWYKESDIKVIIISATHQIEQLSERFGADGYISKPFSPQYLLNEIQNYMSDEISTL